MDISAQELEIILQILLHEHENGKGTPLSVGELAGTLKQTKRNIQRHIGNLKEKELIEVTENTGTYGQREANIYDLSPLTRLFILYKRSEEW